MCMENLKTNQFVTMYLCLVDWVLWVNFKFFKKATKIDKIFIYAVLHTGKSFSEALILASTNPQYDERLFIDLPVQYMKTTSLEHVVYINCFRFAIQGRGGEG